MQAGVYEKSIHMVELDFLLKKRYEDQKIFLTFD